MRSTEMQVVAEEILGVISGSTTDTQPVFEAIAARSAKLTGENSRVVVWIAKDGKYWPAAFSHEDQASDLLSTKYPANIAPDDTVVCSILTKGVTLQFSDIFKTNFERTKRVAIVRGWRAFLGVPLLRDGVVVGVIGATKAESGEFAPRQITLLETFADQAIIAIENVRLFNEIEDKSRQLELANKHKSEFLANMSHELRTPLNAIIGFSEVLIERMFGDVNDKQEEYLKDIHTSGQHLLSLINDILDLSKVEAGRMELNLGSFNLPLAIDNALTLIRERAQRHNITLKSEFDPALLEISADERKLKQILLNLLSNAVKFTPEGGRITVTAGMRGGMAEIAVADTGVGIAETDLAAVFEEFKQVGTDYTRKAEGTGLGLPLAKRFVELHGGTMRLVSEIGTGSTFLFTLPVSQQGRAPAEDAATPAIADTAVQSTPTI